MARNADRLKIWVLEWPGRDVEWDYWEKVVVVAADEAAARMVHPMSADPRMVDEDGWCVFPGWAFEPEDIAATLLGVAEPGVRPGVVCAGYVSGGTA